MGGRPGGGGVAWRMREGGQTALCGGVREAWCDDLHTPGACGGGAGEKDEEFGGDGVEGEGEMIGLGESY